VAQADIVMIAVGTPQNDNDGLPDLTQFHAAVKDIARALKKYTLVVTKSTVPVGTNRQVAKMISEANPGADFDVASNPEFLREGAAVEDFMSPERIVAGIDSKRAREILSKLYEPICMNGAKLFFTTFESAETIKYATNSMLATRIAFINELADFCEKTGANIRDVAKGVGMDYRIGEKFLQPGPGYGGSCFPKDTMALQQMARKAGCPIKIVEATIQSNHDRKLHMVEKIVAAAGGSVGGQTIAVLGVTFKPGTDDMREGASLVILPELQKAGATIRAYDPQGMKEAAKYLHNIAWCEDAYDTMKGADALVIITEWNEFRSLELKNVKALLRKPLVIDLRNIYKRQDMMQHGFHYVSIGRQDVVPGQPWIPDLNMEDEKAA
jgi:UDPglucose 6-dehydrogenase